jgi:hypothetical protein
VTLSSSTGTLTRLAAFCLLAAIAGCGTITRRVEAPVTRFRVIDLMPRFFAFWDSTQVGGAGTTDRQAMVDAFRAEVITPQQSFYDRAAGEIPDERIAKYLDEVGRDVPDMRAISKRISGDLERHVRSFSDSFPDFHYDGRVYFYPSLYVRDGGTMTVDGTTAIMFGVDMIARLNGADVDLAVLLHHELFHLYHSSQLRALTGPQPLYRQIWREGLATYVSLRLNPKRSELEALLRDSTLAAEGPAMMPVLAQEMLDHLDDTSPSYAHAWLTARRIREDVPPRSGYLLGLRIAQMLGTGRSVTELARLDGPELHRQIEQALRVLAIGAELAPAGGGWTDTP